MPLTNSISGADWLAENSVRSYPLVDNATATDLSGVYALPDSLLVDLMLPAPLDMAPNPDGFWIQTVIVYPGGMTLIIAYTADGTGGDAQVVGRVSTPDTQKDNTSYIVAGEPNTPWSGIVGRATIGTTDTQVQVGAYTFAPAATRIVATCLRPTARGLTGLRIQNGNELSDLYTGAITLIAGSNAKLSSSVSGGSTTIRVDAVDGSGLQLGCPNSVMLLNTPIAVFSPSGGKMTATGGGASVTITRVAGSAADLVIQRFDDRAPGLAVRSIAGVPADAQGAIAINTGSAASITVAASGSTVTLSSTKNPCCSATDLDSVHADLAQFSSDLKSQSATQNTIESQLLGLSTADALLQNV